MPASRSGPATAADAFYLDLYHLTHVLQGLQHEQPITFGEWALETAASTFAGSQISVIVLEIPSSDPELRPGRDIGVWNSATLATDAGGWRQLNPFPPACLPLSPPRPGRTRSPTSSRPPDGGWSMHDRRAGAFPGGPLSEIVATFT